MINEEVIPMKHIYNKLVRDRIPEIIENDHKTCKTRILDSNEYIECLKTKLLEECNEVINAEGEDIKKEIADVLEVLEALENTLHIDHQEVLSIKEKKARSNGAFDKKIYLEYVEDSYE
ncbi:phosphoribosyl-ATP pyrophosphohydrolase [Catenibacterium sp.]|uniref:phosphoribosyl-ATP pyrophosphohydrolase n=1 Tax=Catenibacterium sp. TaxID=2049022 RepID=UPI003999EAFF